MGHGIGGSVGSLEAGAAAVSPPVASSDAKAEKWKQGARKTLLNWVSNAIPKYVYIKWIMYEFYAKFNINEIGYRCFQELDRTNMGFLFSFFQSVTF